jgi:hypothetical protein
VEFPKKFQRREQIQVTDIIEIPLFISLKFTGSYVPGIHMEDLTYLLT